MRGVRAIFWDVDNTLIENSAARQSGFRAAIEAMRAIDLPAKSVDDALGRLYRLERYFGSGWPLSLLRLLCIEYQIRSEQQLESLVEAGACAYQRHQLSARPAEGIEDTLHELKKRGYRLGIISNAIARDQIGKLRVAKLLEFFDPSLILISSMFYKHAAAEQTDDPSGLARCIEDTGIFRVEKPWRTLFEEARRRTGFAPEEILFVGDLRTDVVGAKAAGFLSALLSAREGGNNEEDYGAPCFLYLEQPDYVLSAVVELLASR